MERYLKLYPIERVSVSAVDEASAGGIADVELQAGTDTGFLVERIVVRTSGAATPEVFVYAGDVQDSNLRDYVTARIAVADQSSPIYIPPGGKLSIRWTGATASSMNTAAIQGVRVRPAMVCEPDEAALLAVV